MIFFRCGYDDNIERLLSYCQQNSITSIFDVDDLVFEPENIKYVRVLDTFSESDRAAYLRGVERFRQTLLGCDRATCTTGFLARRIGALGKRADVIPNFLNNRQIDIAKVIIPRKSNIPDQIRIGYFSGSNTHQVDFEACEIALLTIMDRFPNVRFVLVGILDLGGHWDRFTDRIERHPMMPYQHMLTILAGTDINLAPLELGNPYCESKSQLKIFEAGLVKVPTVASAVESYTEAIDHGLDGFLASTPSDWADSLQKLIESRELRVRTGERARARALEQFGPEASVRKAIEVYGLPTTDSPDTSTANERLKISWIIPKLQIGSGGHRNILRTAYYLEKFGHELELYFVDSDLSGDALRRTVREHFYELECPMHVYDGFVNPTDVLFATHWLTVEPAVRARNVARELIYFVQDFEPAFAPMGTEYILAENTYRLGLYHITSGPWCENLLKREFGVEADHFRFPVDRQIYHPRPRHKHNKNVIFFARPEMPRRCFELGVMALEAFHRARPDVEIILFGSRKVEGMPLPFPATVQSLLPTIEDLAQLYANADLGVVFSTTNPSLVPYEMMGCGLPVVDLGRPGNEVNYGGRQDIALLADPSPAVMARQIQQLLESPDELAARARKGLEFVETFPSEEDMVRRVEELILKRVASKKRKHMVAAG
ncbi:MAG: glycosyltransferase family 4 protein [Acidobacteriaceae bacterium]|nr:glycosyltransferase family 4 protein [Acidobacteriaceae bacterium]